MGSITPNWFAVSASTGNYNVSGDLTVDTSVLSVDSTNDRVGIGKTNPSYKLDVVGDINYTGTLYNNGVAFSGGAGGGACSWTTSGSNIYYLSGRVGVAISNVAAPLHVGTSSTTDWSVNDGIRVGSGGANRGFMQLGCNPLTGRGWIHTFMNGASGEGSGSYTRLCLQSAGGFVGIGTTNPLFPLHVTSANVSGDPLFQHGFLNNTGAGNGGNQNGALFSVQAKFSGTVHADLYRATSDSRIKKNIIEIDDGEALEKLRMIQPKKYQYVDTITKGDSEVFGFIAQEVRQVFPQAVALDKDVIPDIYTLISVNISTRTIPIGGGKAKNGKLRIIGKKGPKEIDVTAINTDSVSFEVDAIKEEDLSEGRVFVYGYEVEDFHCMKKDFLWAINFAASQEMDRQIQTLQARLDNLISTLTTKKLI